MTTASPHNHSLVKELGADAVFDYNDPSVAERIKEYTKDKLYYAFDTIADERTGAICAAAMASKSNTPLVYSSLLAVEKLPRSDIENKRTLAYTMVGERFTMGDHGPEFPASKEDME